MNIQDNRPNYKLIFEDIIRKKAPEKAQELDGILSKKILTALDILELNKNIFELTKEDAIKDNGKYHSYSKDDILRFLDYQKKHNLNNVQLARVFNLSRNSVSKWKKRFF